MIVPLKATISKKLPLLYKSKFCSLPAIVFYTGAGRKPSQKTGFCVFTCLSGGGADRRIKISGLTVPVATTRQIVFSRDQTAYN
jgi:hypothetical protein